VESAKPEHAVDDFIAARIAKRDDAERETTTPT
jgi:hypothetical protein